MTFRDSFTVSDAVDRVDRAITDRHKILSNAASLMRDSEKCVADAQSVGIQPSNKHSEDDSDASFSLACQSLRSSIKRVQDFQQKQREAAAKIENCRKATETCDSQIARLKKELEWFYSSIIDFLKGSPLRKKLQQANDNRSELEAMERETSGLLSLYQSEEIKEQNIGEEKRGILESISRNCLARIRNELPCIEYLVADIPMEVAGAWDDPRWRQWPTSDSSGKLQVDTILSPVLRYGEYRENAVLMLRSFSPLLEPIASGMPELRMPQYVPFIGGGMAIRITGDPAASLEATQSLVVRAAVLLGQQVKFTLMDPHGLGQAFPMQRFLNARKNAEDITLELREVEQDIRRINQEVLAGEEGLHLLDLSRLASESFEVIVAANFPRGYDRRAVETLFRIAQSGPRAGRYVLFHHDESHDLPREISFGQIANLVSVDLRKGAHSDEMPQPAERQRILESIRSAKGVEHAIDAADFIVPSESEWWRGSSETVLTTPIGVRGASDWAEISFGVQHGMVCAHGAIAAMTGSGKSSLLHVIVLGLATRYSPDELRMYLIDGKSGSELSVYERLPHAEVVALESPAEMSRSVLDELVREMTRRNAMFIEQQVQDIGAYRRKVGLMPRLLLIIDEYQKLFEDDREGVASEHLRRLATQGRSAGIHMLLGSHRFGAPGMVNHKDIFGNVHIKIGMKMESSDIVALTEFGSFGKQLLRGCDMPGKFAMNVTGKDEDTISGKAALLKPEVRDSIIGQLVQRGNGRCPVLFRGDAEHRLSDNLAFQAVKAHRPHVSERESTARLEETHQGWGQTDWVAADIPIGFWVGRRPNIHGHAMLAMRRTVEQNVAIFADKAAARAGMLSGLLRSIGAIYTPEEVVLRVTHPGADKNCPTVQAVDTNNFAAMGFDAALLRDPNQAAEVLDQWIAELERRKQNPQETRTAPTWIWVLVDPDRSTPLRRSGDPLGRGANPRTEQLRQILEQGPANGLHVVICCSALRLLGTVLDERRDLGRFTHRIGLQMSEDDSFALFRNRKASQLQNARMTDKADAIYFNNETSRSIKFRPYVLE
jgi:DNA segregation ATPase FtsK/SpoIIIE, S-DNA-T family